MEKNYWRPTFKCSSGQPAYSLTFWLRRHTNKIHYKTLFKNLVGFYMANMLDETEEKTHIDWVKIPITVDQNQSEGICVSLRQLQYRRGCTNMMLEDILETMRPYLRCLVPSSFAKHDKEMLVGHLIQLLDLTVC